MAEFSVFHRLVQNEPSYTQLLCNLLKRDTQFRSKLLKELFPDFPVETIYPAHIRSEFLLGADGRPDIVISNDQVVAILELKLTALLTNNQDFNADNGYSRLLRNSENITKAKFWTFLAPHDYSIKPSTQDDFIAEKYTWESLLTLCKSLSPANALVTEFAYLLEEKFGSLVFIEEERKMYKQGFPYLAAVKLIRLVEDVGKIIRLSHFKVMSETTKDEWGFYLMDNKKTLLYFGCWPRFSESEKDGAPLCYGVGRDFENDSSKMYEAFRSISPEAVETIEKWLLAPIKAESLEGQDPALKLAKCILSVAEELCAKMLPSA